MFRYLRAEKDGPSGLASCAASDVADRRRRRRAAGRKVGMARLGGGSQVVTAVGK